MSIGEQTCYVALCDVCGEPADGEYLHPTREDAYQSAVDAGWFCIGDDMVCRNCHQQAPEVDPLQDMLPGMTP
jgi:hypothetical protein